MTCDIWQVTRDMWHMTCDTWRVIRDTWHMTHDLWHVTYDKWGELKLLSKLQVPSSYGLGVKVVCPQRMTVSQFLKDKGVCRTAPATPCLLNISPHRWYLIKMFVYKDDLSFPTDLLFSTRGMALCSSFVPSETVCTFWLLTDKTSLCVALTLAYHKRRYGIMTL